MRQTLFFIPCDVAGVPIFGLGVLLALWAAISIVLLIWLVHRQGFNADTWSYIPLLAMIGAVIWFMPKIFPEALPIRGYGVMLLLAGLSGIGLASHRARQMGLSVDTIMSLALWMFLLGIVGARLFHVIEFWQTSYQRDTLAETLGAIANVPQGGLVVYGSLIGAGLAFLGFVRKYRLPALAMADLIAPSMAIGLALGRVGCLLNGCCFGGTSEQPWALTFPPGSPPYMSQLARAQLESDLILSDEEDKGVRVVHVTPGSSTAKAGLRAGDRLVTVSGKKVASASQAYRALGNVQRQGLPLTVETDDQRQIQFSSLPIPTQSLPVHPTQIYSSINALLLCFFLWHYYPFRRRDGEVIALLLSIYPVTRFLIEHIRTDEMPVFGSGMSISQNMSIVILIAIVGLWFYIARQPRGSALPAKSH